MIIKKTINGKIETFEIDDFIEKFDRKATIKNILDQNYRDLMIEKYNSENNRR